jgi:hypothetical protein
MFVEERNAIEEAPLGGVRVPVVSVMASATTDDYHLASDGWRVRRASFGDGCL